MILEYADDSLHYYTVMAWKDGKGKKSRANYIRKFNIYKDAERAYEKCVKKMGPKCYAILYETIDDSTQILKSTGDDEE